MSTWGTLEAEFTDPLGGIDSIRRAFDEREAPTGSESGPTVRQDDDGTIYVHGRLRDVADMADSAVILGWFCTVAEYAEKASLMWEVDDGPRYQYVAEAGEVRKLRGVLDL